MPCPGGGEFKSDLEGCSRAELQIKALGMQWGVNWHGYQSFLMKELAVHWDPAAALCGRHPFLQACPPNVNIKPKFLGSGELVNLVFYKNKCGRLTTQEPEVKYLPLEQHKYVSSRMLSLCPFLGGNWLS